MLTAQQKIEMQSVVELARIYFPPYGTWQRFKPHLTPKVSNYYEAYWQGIINSLDAFCLDLLEPSFSYLNAPLEKLIRTSIHYYKITFLMICQSEQKFLRPEIESWGIDYVFSKKFFLFRLMVEDCLQYLEVLQHTIINKSYEFLSGQEWLNSFQDGVKFLKGDINKNIFDKNTQRFLNKEKKLNNSLNFQTQNLNYHKCSILCLKIWYENQSEIPAFHSWIEASDGYRTMFTKKDSPAFGMLNKTLFTYNFNDMVEARLYPGRGKNKGFS